MDDHRPRASREQNPGAMAAPSEPNPGSSSSSAQSHQTSPKQGFSQRTANNTSPGSRPDLRMTTFSSTSTMTRSSGSSSDQERPGPPIRHLAPPPLAPYVPPEERYYAPLPDRNSKSSSSNSGHLLSSLSGRNPSVPPPQRPAPSHIPPPPSRSQPPPSPPSSRGTYPASSSAVGKRDRPEYIASHSDIQQHRPPSPPSSRETYPAPPRLSHKTPSVSMEMGRTHSHSSQNSGFSAPPTGRVSGTPSEVSSEDEDIGGSRTHSQSEPAPGGNPTLQRPKRTRVLMTHMQQQTLGLLWKKSKFPTTQERETIAVEVGLTPRQVQVWFQNRRQTFRKQIQLNAIPQNSDPADYSDLQKSPRSRRLSLEAANAIPDEQDRVSRWATSSGSSSASYGGVKMYPPASISVLSDPMDPSIPHPPGSAVTSRYTQSPPSPPRRGFESDPYFRHHAGGWHRPDERPTTGSSSYRPGTSSSSSYPGSVASYSGTINRQYRHAPMPIAPPLRPAERRHSYWDNPPSTPHSPLPYSPPPTADATRAGYPPNAPPITRPISSYGKDRERPPTAPERQRRHTTFDTASGGIRRTPSPPIGAKPTHLPPSLAALAITRPISTDGAGAVRSENTLPSLSLNRDMEVTPRISQPFPSAEPAEIGWRQLERPEDVEMTRSNRSRTASDRVASPMVTSRPASRERGEASETQSGSSSLPRFGELFR